MQTVLISLLSVSSGIVIHPTRSVPLLQFLLKQKQYLQNYKLVKSNATIHSCWNDLDAVKHLLRMYKSSDTRERKSRRTRCCNFLQASSWCHTEAPSESIICLRLRCSIKVFNENALTFFCELILRLLPVNLELIELVSTTYDVAVTINIICYY